MAFIRSDHDAGKLKPNHFPFKPQVFSLDPITPLLLHTGAKIFFFPRVFSNEYYQEVPEDILK